MEAGCAVCRRSRLHPEGADPGGTRQGGLSMVGFYACIVMVPCFWLLALFFAVGRERAANWLSGFHGLSKEEKAKYDRARMARVERNACFLWGLIMLLGAGAALWITGWAALAAYGIWMVLFFRDVHLDTDRAFEKYKLPESQEEPDK